ncbi:MAG TPA: hypothetical protein VFU85_03270 [Nocardioides sp.]|nr:hypothetical protein [Nocardioides sp.]
MRSPALLAAACLILAGCDESTGPGSGPGGQATLVVTTSTTGGDPDLDGYRLQLDNSVGVGLDPIDEQTYLVSAGTHELTLAEVAPNCTLSGSASRVVSLAAGATEYVAFSVSCQRTGITVSSSELGIDLDASGYQVIVDGTFEGTVSANGSLVVSRLEPGEHSLHVQGVAPNCLLDGSPTRTITVVNTELTPVAFSATCTSTFAVLQVQVATTGPRPDPGYLVEWSPSPAFGPEVSSRSVLSADAFHDWPVTVQQHVRLTGVAPNCNVLGGAVRQAAVQLGTPVRDTATVDFQVSCLEGSGTVRVTVSPTGDELPEAFTVQLFPGGCTDPYYCAAGEPITFEVATHGTTSLELPSDTYFVQLNPGGTCAWQPDLQRTFDLGIGATQDIEFTPTCGRPVLRVSAPTTGTNPDTQYTVALWVYDYYYGFIREELGPLVPGETLEHRLFPNFFQVGLEGVAANCTVQVQNPTAGDFLTWGGALTVTFPVACGP